MITGKYPSRSGFEWVLVPKSKRGIHPNEITQTEALKSKGYKTAIYGKWHLGPIKEPIYPFKMALMNMSVFHIAMIPPKWQDIALLNGNDTLEMNPDQSKLTELYTQKAISFIKKNKKEKFFVYLPYAMSHSPLHPGSRFAGKSKRGTYGDVVEEIDWYVGEILATLKKEKLEKNTIVWFILPYLLFYALMFMLACLLCFFAIVVWAICYEFHNEFITSASWAFGGVMVVGISLTIYLARRDKDER